MGPAGVVAAAPPGNLRRFLSLNILSELAKVF